MPGVPVDGWVWVTVDIEIPYEWDLTADGIVGWAFSVHVDPDVLMPWSVYGASFGYFLYDCVDWNACMHPHYPSILVGEINQATGDIRDIAEFILGYETVGVGAGGNSSDPTWYGAENGLCRLRFRSKSETAHTVIDITNAYYYILAEPGAVPSWEKIPFYVVDGHYNEPPCMHASMSTPRRSLTVERVQTCPATPSHLRKR